ncbi:MAG: PmoA family protein [Verrucomicrobiales bacterium]|nr:PmoA family protein [Verrucomicrobiales bacterium]
MKNWKTICCVILGLACQPGRSEETWRPERCELLPLPRQQVAFEVDGEEKLSWHFGSEYPRPFFYPLKGPSGVSLTRMGHPGAQNHDHHRSVWFAHHDVNGVSYWADSSKATIRQKHWYRYRDGDEEAVMASLLGWYDEEGQEVMEQDVFAALLPGEGGEYFLEIQTNCRPSPGAKPVELGKTNFGFFAVRVSKSLSHYFGGGVISNSEGQVGEKDIFGKAAKWMDYSGPVATGGGPDRKVVTEGITYFDHPHNPRYPTKWHVRSDGWMGASFCMDEGMTLSEESPITLRYLLHVHSGAYDSKVAGGVAERFGKRKSFVVAKSKQPHRQYEVWREGQMPEAEKK